MSTSAPDFWAKMSEVFQQNLSKSWGEAMQHFQTIDLGGLKPTVGESVPAFKFSSEKLQTLQGQYFKDASAMWNQSLHNSLQVKDRRFSGEAWAANPMAAFNAASYLLNARTLMGLADAVEADEKTRTRIRFSIEQWVAAASPSNFLAFNAEAQKKAIDTQGESIAKGVQNLLHDLQQHRPANDAIEGYPPAPAF
jgi:polyhydroxyalkanoate synthase